MDWAIAGSIISFITGSVISYIAVKATNKKTSADLAVKLSDYRVDWIHRLRDSMAEFQSYAVTPGIDHSMDRKFYELGTKIELLMNPLDEDFETLNMCQYRMLSAKTTLEKYMANPEYVKVCQRILKREWERVKVEAFKD